MKLSERMEELQRDRDSIVSSMYWLDEVRDLEAELASERERAQMLAGQLDRERFLRREAEGKRDAGLLTWQTEGAKAIAILHLVYSMREHALRGRIANQRAELRRLNVQVKRNADVLAEHARLRDLARFAIGWLEGQLKDAIARAEKAEAKLDRVRRMDPADFMTAAAYQRMQAIVNEGSGR